MKNCLMISLVSIKGLYQNYENCSVSVPRFYFLKDKKVQKIKIHSTSNANEGA